MKKTLKLAAVGFVSLFSTLSGVLHAQGYSATAQLTYLAVGDGTYNYTLLLQNNASSSESINTFWFAWIPDDYGYDLLPSTPNVTGEPYGWYPYVQSGNYYYPDGNSIDFYNYYGSDLAPGQSYTFNFNSADSPTTLMQNSPYNDIPTLTSYTYGDAGDSQRFVVSIAPAPEPSTAGLLCICAVGLIVAVRRRHLNIMRIDVSNRRQAQ